VKEPPEWMLAVETLGSVIYNLWYLSALCRWVTAKGTRVNAVCKEIMCEVRPIFWPAYVANQLVYQIRWAGKDDHSWWESPPSHWFFTLLNFACVWFYWRMFKDDEDDDRWQRRKKRLRKTIKKRLTLPRPAWSQGS